MGSNKDGKAGTFDFLGFTHYCGKSKRGRFRVKRKTSSKKQKAKIKDFKMWIKRHRNTKVKDLIDMINVKLRGHYQYFGITDNFKSISKFYRSVVKLLWKWLNRRSQRKSYTRESFKQLLENYPILKPKVYVNIYDKT